MYIVDMSYSDISALGEERLMLDRGMLVKALLVTLDYVAAFNCVILHAPLGTGDRGRVRTSTHPFD